MAAHGALAFLPRDVVFDVASELLGAAANTRHLSLDQLRLLERRPVAFLRGALGRGLGEAQELEEISRRAERAAAGLRIHGARGYLQEVKSAARAATAARRVVSARRAPGFLRLRECGAWTAGALPTALRYLCGRPSRHRRQPRSTGRDRSRFAARPAASRRSRRNSAPRSASSRSRDRWCWRERRGTDPSSAAPSRPRGCRAHAPARRARRAT